MNNNHHCPKCGMPTTVEQTQYFRTEACEHCLEHWQITYAEGCCFNPDYETVSFVMSNGVVVARSQCKSCGQLHGNALGGYSKEERESLPPYNKEKRDTFYNQRSELARVFYQRRTELTQKRHERQQRQWWQSYSDYLQSPQWKAKRELILKRDNYTCQACLKNRANQVHHKSYEFVDFTGKEPCFDLIAICEECHVRLHKIRNQRKAS